MIEIQFGLEDSLLQTGLCTWMADWSL